MSAAHTVKNVDPIMIAATFVDVEPADSYTVAPIRLAYSGSKFCLTTAGKDGGRQASACTERRPLALWNSLPLRANNPETSGRIGSDSSVST